MFALPLHDYELPAPVGRVVELNLDDAVTWLTADPRHALILRPGQPGSTYKPGPRQTAVYRASTPDLHDTDRYILQVYPTGTVVIYPNARAAVLAGCAAGHKI